MSKALFDLGRVDQNRVEFPIEEIRKVNPQRFEFEQIDGIFAAFPEEQVVVGFKDVKPGEFWVRGHIPGAPLFPFLAVLVCTMGSLIVIIAVLARQARVQASQAAKAKTAEAKTELDAAREMARWKNSVLAEAIPKARADLAAMRLRLGSIEDHSRHLREELAGLEEAAKQLQAKGPREEGQRRQTESELAALRGRLAEAERQVADARRAAASRTKSYAVVPYEGPNATRRRPIYLDCRAEAIPRIRCPRSDGGFAVIHPFSGSPKKNWPLERYAELRRRLGAQWCAGPEEALDGAVRFEDLYELGCWLASARLYIGNDSGITHLAAAVGTPVVALFGPSDPAVWRPRGPKVRIVATPSPGQAMDQISLDEVVQAVRSLW